MKISSYIIKSFMVINYAIVSYFSITYIIYLLNIKHVLLGVINEMLTFPLLFFQVPVLVASLILLFIKPKNTLFLISVLALAVCTTLTIGSLILN